MPPSPPPNRKGPGLPVPRLLRWARCMYGRRGLGVRPVIVGASYAADGQRSLVLGPGSTVSSLINVHSSAGVCPISRLLRRWWVRRGWSSRLRSLLLRRHVDEDDEDLARANAGSGSHNLDAPTWRAKDAGGLTHEHLWDRPTESFRFGGGEGCTKSGSRRSTRSVYPSSGRTDA